jgi:glucose/arabinose dehydrogenase
MHCWLGMKSGSKLGSGMRGTRSALWRGTANPVSLGLLLLGLAWSGGPWAGAATLPPGFTEELVLGPWNEVVGLTFEPEQQTVGGPMYVWERGGRVWIVENGVRQSTPLIDLSEEVGGWRDFGLLGFALHPNFRQNGYLYLSYVVDHHHLTKFGTPDYHPDTNEYFMATIGRITRYTARASDGFHSVDPASRKVLLGESITNGFPITYQSHGVGSLVFGTDGSLMASCGDGGSYSTTDLGSASETYFTQALAEGIIRPKENIGALRAQLVDCLSGKIIRIDPETGNGLPSNPFYEPASPRSAKSRVWSLGHRNPYRMTLRPGTGSHSQADANPGALYIGDVGWRTFEDLNVVTGSGQNFGWSLYEGLEAQASYRNPNIGNPDAPNPLYGTGGCTQQYFYFRYLLRQDSLNPPTWPNPCNTSVQVPASIPRFVHSRPAIDWKHEIGPARTGVYTPTGAAAVTNVGATGSPVSGLQFGGTSSIGGTWYQGDDFPPMYKNTYFHGDYEGAWIRNFVFNTNNRPVAVRDFLTNGGGIVCIATHPVEGSLYYVTWSSNITHIRYTGSGNQPPKAAVTVNKNYGPSPLTVQFDGSASADPEGMPLLYRWDFGDGSMTSSLPNPSHTFTAPSGAPVSFPVTLTVTDVSNATAQAAVLISVNNSPPSVTVTSPTNGMRYPLTGETTYALTANITDAEHGPDQLACEWQTILHHNQHTHADPVDTNCTTSTVISPVGCDGENYFYSIILKVTDAAGLSTTREVRVYPDCPGQPPILKYLGREGTGAIRWQLTGDSARTYLVEGSTNLVGWSPVTSVQPVTGTAEFNDANASALQFRFYRAVLVP